MVTGLYFRNVYSPGDALDGALRRAQLPMERISEWLFVPEATDEPAELYAGYGFEAIGQDVFGRPRSTGNRVGAISDLAAARAYTIDRERYGPPWFSPRAAEAQAQVHAVSPGQGGDIIELGAGDYPLVTSLDVDKDITLRARGEDIVRLKLTGQANVSAINLHPGGSIRLEKLTLQGSGNQVAFAPRRENMDSPYKLRVTDCVIEDFTHVLEATRGTFAESISLQGTTVRNCANGLLLAADDKGDYNAEMVTITDWLFENVLHFYRGGYDKSTIGGYLRLSGSTGRTKRRTVANAGYHQRLDRREYLSGQPGTPRGHPLGRNEQSPPRQYPTAVRRDPGCSPT